MFTDIEISVISIKMFTNIQVPDINIQVFTDLSYYTVFTILKGLYQDKDEYKSCSNVTWNPVGDGMMFQDWSIPIFVLTEESDVHFLIEKVSKHECSS